MNKPLSTRISVSPPLPPLASQRGAVSVAAALSLTALMGMGAMAVDVGNVMVARNDVQNAADAAALRGAGLLYTQGSSSPNFSAMNNSPGGPVYETANLNTPIEKPDTLTVKSNYWQSISPSAPSNDAAVRVSYTKQVNLFFAGVLGMKTMSVTATSTAIVQNSSVLGAGGTHLPIAIPQCAISQYWNSNTDQPKTDQIQVGPTHTCNAGGNGNQENQNNQENQGNQQDNQQQQQDNQNQQQQQNDSENSSSSLRVTKAQQGTRHAAPLMNYGVSNHPRLVRLAFTLPESRALQYRDYRSGFVRVTNSGADRNGSANTVTGTGAGAGGPGNGNGPGQGAGQGLGAGASVGASVSTGTGTSAGASVSIGSGQGNSCITGQFSTLTTQADDSNFSHSEHVAQDGNPEDLHVGDQIDLENGDYSNSQGNQGSQGNSGDQHHSQRETRQRLAQSPSHSGWIRADHLAPSINSMRFSRLQLSTPSSGFLRVDQQGDRSQNQGNDNNQGSQNQGNDNNQGNQQGGGDPYTTINNCSAAGNHSCEYSIVPVVDSAASVPHGKQTIVGFACLHVLSAANGTINATLSMGCVSNSNARVVASSSPSGSSAQTSYGVVSPPRLAR
ncbi:MAG: hypothetical protein GJU77_08220 [Ferrovum sp.]|jgi:Flp pilus assembly protein TadG|nr:hypothetical protein [Ferrovum sp.]NDU89577.1 hypothetical protein [Ferrovum sp.]